MRSTIIVGLVSIVAVTGCGGGSVEHESYKSPNFRGERTRIHVRSHQESSGGYRVVEGHPVNLHVHAGNGQSVCIEITTGRE